MVGKQHQDNEEKNVEKERNSLEILGAEVIGIVIQCFFWFLIGAAIWRAIPVPADMNSEAPSVAEFATNLYQFHHFSWELLFSLILLISFIVLNARPFVRRVQEEISRMFYSIAAGTITLAVIMKHLGQTLGPPYLVIYVAFFCVFFGIGFAYAVDKANPWRNWRRRKGLDDSKIFASTIGKNGSPNLSKDKTTDEGEKKSP